MVISKVLAATDAPVLGFTTPKWLELAALWFTLTNINLHWGTAISCGFGRQTIEAPGNALCRGMAWGMGSAVSNEQETKVHSLRPRTFEKLAW